ncbi:MAG: ChpI protein [Spirochaetota bacterium]
MKTAVSLSEKLFKEAEKIAAKLGIPRSQLFAKALEEFIAHHQSEDITEKLNRVYDKNGEIAGSDTRDAGLESLRELTRDDAW